MNNNYNTAPTGQPQPQFNPQPQPQPQAFHPQGNNPYPNQPPAPHVQQQVYYVPTPQQNFTNQVNNGANQASNAFQGSFNPGFSGPSHCMSCRKVTGTIVRETMSIIALVIALVFFPCGLIACCLMSKKVGSCAACGCQKWT
jgi:hypothetical protein